MPLLAPIPGQVPVDPVDPESNPFAKTDFSKTLGRDNALPGQNYFDPAIDKTLIPSQLERDSKFYSDTLNHGVGNNDVPQPNTVHGDDPMTKALASRYEGQVNDSVRSVKTQNDVTSHAMASDNMSRVGSELGAEYQNEVQNFSEQYNFEMQRQNLYNQWKTAQSQATQGLFGAIFSGLGSVGGAVIGAAVGGPGGAVAGAAVGSKL
jgi:hypothetical protein